jgi:uracil DNA glycosylase
MPAVTVNKIIDKLFSLTTVENTHSVSHISLWRPFIQYVIQIINDYCPGTIVMLWGIDGKAYYRSCVSNG